VNEKAKYIVYAKHKDEQVVKVPDSEIVIKKASIYGRKESYERLSVYEVCGTYG
jgi:ABC-type Na+ transport system ATPase subunit NatA